MPPAPLPQDFECSARRDVRYWLCLVLGFALLAASISLSRAEYCQQPNNCTGWAISILQFTGGMFAIFGLVYLRRNASRGSRFDPATGELHWWYDRTISDPGVSGHAHPRDIKRIILVSQESSSDETILIGPDDRPLPGFESRVIPWRNDIWARKLVAAYPHIVIEDRR